MEESTNPTPAQETSESPVTQADASLPEALPAAQESPAYSPEMEEETAAPNRSKKWYIIGGLLIVFLAAAVFFGAQLLKPKTNVGMEGGGGMMLSSKGGPGGAKSVRLNMTPAKELPQDRPTANGLFVRREDQSIFIGTGNVRMMVKKGAGSSGSGDASGSFDGPVVEVVVNHQTKIYQDITEMTPPESNSGSEVTVQQVVKEGSLDDLGSNTLVTVWGDKQGDRIIARVITFR